MPDYPLGDVVGIRIYRNDVEVVREGSPIARDVPCRGEVTEFSWASRRRLAFVANNTSVELKTMITLTYPREFPSDGKDVKRHLNAFLTWLRRDLGGVSYLWFLEFQRRGAPHVHLLIDWRGSRELLRHMRFRVSAQWYRIVGSGDDRHLQAGTRVETIRKRDGARRYAVKYATKMHQKLVPEGYRNVGRFWGCSRDVKPEQPQLISCREDDIRGTLEEWEFAPGEDRCLYRVLYNQAGRFRAALGARLDTDGESGYTGSESQSLRQPSSQSGGMTGA